MSKMAFGGFFICLENRFPHEAGVAFSNQYNGLAHKENEGGIKSLKNVGEQFITEDPQLSENVLEIR